MRWRWDQGRLDYFRFDSTRSIARVLVTLDGTRLNEEVQDPLRAPLAATRLPLRPAHYRVWRNYARVFGAAWLATGVGNRLRVTDLCQALAVTGDQQLTVDDYFAFLVPRFYFPSPVFAGYSHVGPVSYPFCAILRYLMTHVRRDGFGAVTLGEVFSEIIGSGCIGSESLDFYRALRPTARRPAGDEERQIREFLIFFSQFSFLQWTRPDTLFLDVDALDQEALRKLEELATPIPRRRLKDRASELLATASWKQGQSLPAPVPVREVPEDIVFTEGSRIRTNHLRIERSPKLRALLFASLRHRPVCHMCGRDMQVHYPWVAYANMLETHHLLPLGSALKVGIQGTSVSDLVALCRSCHGSVHVYYRQWLRDNALRDFRSKQEAISVYEDCKRKYVR